MLSAGKSSKLTKRIKRIEKELSSVSSDLRTVARKAKRHPEQFVDPLPPASSPLARREEPALIETPPPAAVRESRAAYDTGLIGGSAAQDTPMPEFHGTSPYPEETRRAHVAQEGSAAAQSGPVPRENKQFASYFMGTGLQASGPLRQERHLQRNKAIFLIGLFVLVLIMIIYSLSGK